MYETICCPRFLIHTESAVLSFVMLFVRTFREDLSTNLNNPIGLKVVTVTTLSDNSDNQIVVIWLSLRQCHSDNFLVVLDDNLDNFLDDNHKVVIVTIRLTIV